MNNIIIFNISFYVENYNIILDKSSPILKHKFGYSKDKTIEIKKTKEILSNINECIKLCKLINTHYKLYRCLEFIDEIILNNELKSFIYNNLSTNVTKNIFSINDIDYLKNLYEQKLKTLEKYEQESTNSYNSIEERNIQRSKLLLFKKQFH